MHKKCETSIKHPSQKKLWDFRWTDHHPYQKQSLSDFSLPKSTKIVHTVEFLAGIGKNSGQLNCEFIEFQMNLIIFGHSTLLELPPKVSNCSPTKLWLVRQMRLYWSTKNLTPKTHPAILSTPQTPTILLYNFPSVPIRNPALKTNRLVVLKAPVLHSDVRRCFGASSIVVGCNWWMVGLRRSRIPTTRMSFLETSLGESLSVLVCQEFLMISVAKIRGVKHWSICWSEWFLLFSKSKQWRGSYGFE